MNKWLGKYSDPLYALMRFIVGLLFACHGAQKLFGLLGGIDGHGASVSWDQAHLLFALAGLIELFGGLLIALGLFASWAAFIASGEMAVAYFMQHASGGFWPIVNRGELAVVYCFVFLFIAAHGAGKWSLAAGKPSLE